MDFDAILRQATAIAQQAGSVLIDHFRRPNSISTKSNVADLVTEADKAAEAVIVRALHEQFPDHHIVGEEGGGMGAPADRAHFFWYVDPIDGTTNFVSRIPHFCVSIALTDAQMQPLVGVVYHPIAEELYTARQGGGAYLNGEALRVSRTESLGNAVVASGFPYDKWTNPENNAEEWSAFVRRARGVRRFGSAALDFCYVAAGRFDGYWERSLNPWDALAGMLLVLEAGGRVTDYHGDPFPQRHKSGLYLATNGLLHPVMSDLLKRPG